MPSLPSIGPGLNGVVIREHQEVDAGPFRGLDDVRDGTGPVRMVRMDVKDSLDFQARTWAFNHSRLGTGVPRMLPGQGSPSDRIRQTPKIARLADRRTSGVQPLGAGDLNSLILCINLGVVDLIPQQHPCGRSGGAELAVGRGRSRGNGRCRGHGVPH